MLRRCSIPARSRKSDQLFQAVTARARTLGVVSPAAGPACALHSPPTLCHALAQVTALVARVATLRAQDLGRFTSDTNARLDLLESFSLQPGEMEDVVDRLAAVEAQVGMRGGRWRVWCAG